MRPGEIIKLKYAIYDDRVTGTGEDYCVTGKKIAEAGQEIKILYYVNPHEVHIQVIAFGDPTDQFWTVPVVTVAEALA